MTLGANAANDVCDQDDDDEHGQTGADDDRHKIARLLISEAGGENVEVRLVTGAERLRLELLELQRHEIVDFDHRRLVQARVGVVQLRVHWRIRIVLIECVLDRHCSTNGTLVCN